MSNYKRYKYNSKFLFKKKKECNDIFTKIKYAFEIF